MTNNIILSNKYKTFSEIFVFSISSLPVPMLHFTHNLLVRFFLLYKDKYREQSFNAVYHKAFQVYSIDK